MKTEANLEHILPDLRVHAVPIETLREDPQNARFHDEENLEAIRKSVTRFQQRRALVVQRATRKVEAGNGLLAVAKALGWTHVAAVFADDTDAEAAAYGIADNRAAELAEWNESTLTAILAELAGTDHDLANATGFDDAALEEMLANLNGGSSSGGEGGEVDYTKKIEVPVYTPKLDKPPPVSDLFDREKSKALQKRIASVELPNEVRAFLRAAADRHTVFNYEQIAEYYAHAPKEVQELMEESALVIIDFDKAIEHGFVAMTKKLVKAYEENLEDGHGDEA